MDGFTSIESWTAAGIILFATLCRTTFGFGEALIAMPLLSMVVGVRTAAPLMAIVSITTSIGILSTDWRSVRFTSAWRLILAAALGIPLGMYILVNVPEEIVKSILAVGIIAFAIFSLTRPQTRRLKTDRFSFLFGFVSGVLGGAYNTLGPPIVIYASLRGWPAREFRATLQSFFFPAGLFIMASHAIRGGYTLRVLWCYAAALPMVAISLIIGRRLHQRLRSRQFVRYIYLLLIGIGVMLLINCTVSVLAAR